MFNITNFIILTLGSISLLLALNQISISQENKRLTREVNYFEKTYPTQNGWTGLWTDKFHPDGVNYHLISLNGGRDWLALDSNKRLIGDVKTVYPGLLEHTEQMKNLDKISQNSSQSEKMAALTAAGFTVEVK
jgi:hypothetical protein